MARAQAVSNKEVIETLVAKGYPWSENTLVWDDTKEVAGPFSEIFTSSSGTYGWAWYNPAIYSYMIPVEIYKKEIARYNIQLKVGTQVRKRKRSTRKYERSTYVNNLGDTKDWDHLGIGTGKEYKSDKIREILYKFHGVSQSTPYNSLGWSAQRLVTEFNEKYSTALLIGNRKYATNVINSATMAQHLRDRNIKNKLKWYEREFDIEDFIQYVPITGEGFFGQKQLINGVITDVYVHFLYPKWERKRESRYKVLFETGASGIFTSDYLEQVYDTDIEPDEVLYRCSHSHGCKSKHCTHKHVHEKLTNKSSLVTATPCDMPCFEFRDAKCEIVYDYNTLIDTTCGKALDYVREDV